MKLNEAREKYKVSSTYFYHLKNKAKNDEELEKLLKEYASKKENKKVKTEDAETGNKNSDK